MTFTKDDELAASGLLVDRTDVLSGRELTTYRCPACGEESVFCAELDRCFHIDGTDNRKCWRATLRGDVRGKDGR